MLDHAVARGATLLDQLLAHGGIDENCHGLGHGPGVEVDDGRACLGRGEVFSPVLHDVNLDVVPMGIFRVERADTAEDLEVTPEKRMLEDGLRGNLVSNGGREGGAGCGRLTTYNALGPELPEPHPHLIAFVERKHQAGADQKQRRLGQRGHQGPTVRRLQCTPQPHGEWPDDSKVGECVEKQTLGTKLAGRLQTRKELPRCPGRPLSIVPGEASDLGLGG